MSHYGEFYQARDEAALLKAYGPSKEWDWEAWANERSLRLLWAQVKKSERELAEIKQAISVLTEAVK